MHKIHAQGSTAQDVKMHEIAQNSIRTFTTIIKGLSHFI